MKITFVVSTFGLAGGPRVTATYANALATRGHTVTIVAQPTRIPKSYRNAWGLIDVRPDKRKAAQKRFNLDESVQFIVLDKARPPSDGDIPISDAVIATWWKTAFWTAALSSCKGQKFYFIQGHEVFDHLPWQISRGSYYLPLKKIAVSQWLVDIMRDEYGDSDVALIHNSVDMEQFHAPPRGKQAAPTVGLMYTPAHFKGLDVSLRAIGKARERIPGLKVVAFGSQPPIKDLPLPANSVFHLSPPQDEIRNIYASCDAWLFGSREEGFGLPILEAMACRTPVVGTRAGAAPELIQDGINGYLTGIEDSEALADRLVRIFSMTPTEWQAMSDAALATVQGYTWEDATDRFEQVLLDAAG